MASGSSLTNYEREFDGLVEGLMIMEHVMKSEDLVIIYANSLPAEYDTWLQGQMATIDKIELSEFEGLVQEETQHMINFSNSENSDKYASAKYRKYTSEGEEGQKGGERIQAVFIMRR